MNKYLKNVRKIQFIMINKDKKIPKLKLDN